ncbi:hypothetical protein R84B8_01829 [Treponema sp. R8-4-B8]
MNRGMIKTAAALIDALKIVNDLLKNPQETRR